jgi:hybrid polyketide synthase/nonribosomal peptide synthetase ACE1
LKLIEGAVKLARSHFANVIHLPSLEELNNHGLAESSSVLCLTELNEQLLERQNASKFNALKVL